MGNFLQESHVFCIMFYGKLSTPFPAIYLYASYMVWMGLKQEGLKHLVDWPGPKGSV